MTSGPIQERLRERVESDEKVAARAAELLRAIPEPALLSDVARRRVLGALGTASRKGRGAHLTALQWAVFSILIVSTAAASTQRVWFPRWFHRRATVVEKAAGAVAPDPAPPAPPARAMLPMLEPRASSKAVSSVPSEKPRVSKTAVHEEPKSAQVRPRLLSDPQDDALPRALPKVVYDADTYSALLDVCVSAEGHVTRAWVVRGQQPELDREIVEAVQRWKYLPGEMDGQPIDMCFPLVYRIQVQHD